MLENPWSAVGNPTSALGSSGSSFGPSCLAPIGIHQLLLSNLTAGYYLFDDDDDKVEQLRSQERMKMGDERREVLLAGAERDDHGDAVARDAAQRQRTAARQQTVRRRLPIRVPRRRRRPRWPLVFVVG